MNDPIEDAFDKAVDHYANAEVAYMDCSDHYEQVFRDVFKQYEASHPGAAVEGIKFRLSLLRKEPGHILCEAWELKRKAKKVLIFAEAEKSKAKEAKWHATR